MEALKASKNQALLDCESKNMNAKGKHKGNDKKNFESKPKEELNPSDGASGSKKDNHKRFEKTKCTYCNKGNHPDSSCMKKAIDQMARLLEHNHISLQEGARNTNSGSNTFDHKRCHALKDGF